MEPITLPGIDDYAERHTTPDPPLLRGIAAETRRSFERPQMLVGPVEGRLLQMLVFALRPRLVLEIGTFTGYSALAMAEVLPPDGRIVTCELSPRHAEAARRHIAASPYSDRITVELGPALDTVRRIDGTFDFVFVDADQANYPDYFEAILPRLAPRGLLAVDNTLWNGSVLAGADGDLDTTGIQRFNDAVAADPRVAAVLLTVRDGLTLVRRA